MTKICIFYFSVCCLIYQCDRFCSSCIPCIEFCMFESLKIPEFLKKILESLKIRGDFFISEMYNCKLVSGRSGDVYVFYRVDHYYFNYSKIPVLRLLPLPFLNWFQPFLTATFFFGNKPHTNNKGNSWSYLLDFRSDIILNLDSRHWALCFM